MAFSGHPILDEIKGGLKLRPTKTVDKSKPIFLAEGETADFSAATDKSKNLENAPAPIVQISKAASPRTSWKDRIETPVAPALDFPGMGVGGGPPPPPPPPPGFALAPPPPPPAPVIKKAANPKLLKLGGNVEPSDEDRGALLKSIQSGIRLKKTVTNDKSGLVVDEDLKKSSVKLVEPTEPPPELLIPKPKSSPTGRRGQLTPTTLSPKGISSEDERYLTPDERDFSDYGTPEPEERPRSKWSRTPEPEPPKKIDYAFDEKNLRVTAESLAEEIPKGLAASKIAKWLQAENVDGGATLPRPSFSRASPMRTSPFSEVNNNMDKPTLEQLKLKAPSKWAVVDTGGLRRPGQGNVPADKSREATPRATTPRPYRDRTGSNLDAPILDRARTASPTLEFSSSRRRSSARESSPEFKIEENPEPPAPVAIPKKKRASITKKTESEAKSAKKSEGKQEEEPTKSADSKIEKKPLTRKNSKDGLSKTAKKTTSDKSASSKLSTPLSIKTDFSQTAHKSSEYATDYTSPRSKPEIKETPPTPKYSLKTNGTAYTYKKERVTSPPPESATVCQPSPVSSMSSASVPSPSSIGSTSPDQAPRRARPINPNFDKFKEKFATGEVSNATPSGMKSDLPHKLGTISVKDNPFAKAASSSPRASISASTDEAAAVKKAVKEAAAKNMSKSPINVPISAPWHNQKPDPYSPNYSSRDKFSPSNYEPSTFSPSYSSRRNFDFPSTTRETSWRWESTPYSYTRANTDLPSSTSNLDDVRRFYRFNIDFSLDNPLTLTRR